MSITTVQYDELNIEWFYRNRDVPERNLLVAIIRRALEDHFARELSPIAGHTEPHAMDQRDATHWLTSFDRDPWSLFWVCEQLYSCPEVVWLEIQRRVYNGEPFFEPFGEPNRGAGARAIG